MFGDDSNVAKMAEESHRRYAEIMRDVELMIDDHSELPPSPSRRLSVSQRTCSSSTVHRGRLMANHWASAVVKPI